MVNLTLIVLYTILFTILIYCIKRKNFLNPLIIYIFIITISYTIYYFYNYKYLNTQVLSNTTYLCYIIMPIAFILGYFYTFPILNIVKSKNIKYLESDNYLNKRVFKIILILSLIIFFINIIQAIFNGLSGPGKFFFNLRYYTTIERREYFGSHIMLFAQVYLLILIVNYRYNKKYNKYIKILLIIWGISTFFSMARTNVMLLLLSTSMTYILSRKYIKYKDMENSYNSKKMICILISISILFILTYFIFAILTGKEGNNIIMTFFNYFGSPIVAFDSHIVSYPAVSKGTNIFAPISKILGINIYEYKEVGRSNFNVFTAMSDPYLDFGVMGVFFVNVFLGIGYSYLFKKVENGDLYSIVFYSLMCFPIIMAFYEYTFSYVQWIYYFIIIKIYKFIIGKNFKFSKSIYMGED